MQLESGKSDLPHFPTDNRGLPMRPPPDAASSDTSMADVWRSNEDREAPCAAASRGMTLACLALQISSEI